MKQKWGIALVSGLIWFGAIISLIAAITALAMGSELTSLGMSIGLPDISGMFLPLAIFGIIFSALYILLGYMLWIHNTYAWYIVFILLFLGFILLVWGAIWSMSIAGIVGLVLPVIQLWALTNKETMSACKADVLGWKGW